MKWKAGLFEKGIFYPPPPFICFIFQQSWCYLLFVDVISFFATRKCQKPKKLVNVVNIEEENLHIFWTSWEIPLKFSGKTWLMIILKVTKEQISTNSPKNIFLEEPHRERGGGGCFLAVLGLRFAELDNA